MSIETVFGSAGHDHITGAQLARMIEGTLGKGDYVLRTQNELKATMQTANTVRVDTGDLVHDGRLATCERYTDLTVDSGVTGMRRNDLVVARFLKSSDQHQLVVVKGHPTAGEPSDPDLNDGAAGVAPTADMPLWRVRLDGVSPTLERVFSFAPTTSQVRDAVSSLESDSGWRGLWVSADGHINIKARKIGRWVTVNGKFRNQDIGTDWRSITTLPAGMRPGNQTYFAGTAAAGDHVVQMDIEADGIIYAKSMEGTVSGALFSATFIAEN